MEYLTIGKMAKMNHISEQTLRLYDRNGLLTPAFIDPSNGYRYFNIKQCARLDMIQYMKAFGMPLKEIKQQLDNTDIDNIKAVLLNQRSLIKKKLSALNQMQHAIEKSIENYNRYTSAPKPGTILLEYLQERKIYAYDCKINIYDYGLETYEYILRSLKTHIKLKHLPLIYFCNAGSILRKSMLDKNQLVSNEIFLFIDEHFSSNENIETIPAGTFACIYCDSFWKEKEYAHKILSFIEEHNYKITGDYICEVVAELPIFPQNERNMLIKIQIPVNLK